jgi:DNA-binding NtrC family response regulator
MCEGVAKDIVETLKGHPMSCAVVDGDVEYRNHLAKVLDDLGFLVFHFGNSREFEIQHRECRFDVVILSWSVEPLSGGAVVESIRRLGEPFPALVIECDGGESVSFQLALAPVGFLFKPFDVGHLMEVLRKAVEDKRR